MNKDYVLKKSEEIKELVDKKNSVGNKYYAIYFDDAESEAQVAISISKKCGSAPIRNHEKRVVREIFRINYLEKINNVKCLIIIKKESLNLTYDLKQKELDQLVNKMIKKRKETK